MEYYREYYRPKGIFECSLYDGIEDTFKALCEAGYKLALATAKPEIFAEKIAKHFGLDAYLSCISGASLDSSREDKAEIISIALKALDIKDPTASFMVGDRSYDLEGGAKNGLFTIGALYGYGTEEEMSSACAAAKTPKAGSGSCTSITLTKPSIRRLCFSRISFLPKTYLLNDEF